MSKKVSRPGFSVGNLEQPRQGARGELLVGNPCFSSSGRHRPAQAPQPDTNPSQLRFAVKRALYAELRGEAESKKASLEGGLGGEP